MSRDQEGTTKTGVSAPSRPDVGFAAAPPVTRIPRTCPGVADALAFQKQQQTPERESDRDREQADPDGDADQGQRA